MKKIFILVFCLILTNTMLAQTPKGFSYQAIIRNTEGQPIVSQKVGLKITIQDALGTPYYTETHSPTTSPLGVVAVVVGAGEGKPLDFASIPWEEGSLFLKLGVDLTGGDNYTPIGESMLQAVPYALHAQKASEFVSSGTGSADDPLFAVRNDLGQIVFAVYQTGVRVYVEDDGKKSARGGFAVGGLSYENKQTVEYLRVTPDSVRINIVKPSVVGKSARGGFAVGGLSYENKALPNDLLFISPEKARIYVDPSGSKSARGGFAVGGLSYENKGEASNFLFLTPENYFIGHESGLNITAEGVYNSTLGYMAGKSLTSGKSNILIGFEAGMNTTTGRWNTVLGFKAGRDNNSGDFNTFLGYYAGWKNTTGGSNVFIGNESGQANTTGSNNVFLGFHSGFSNLASFNTFLGYQSGYSNEMGTYNSFIGYRSGFSNSSGASNVFMGHSAGFSNENGLLNVYIGKDAGLSSTSANSNVFIGESAGKEFDGTFGNVFIGQQAAAGVKGGHRNVMIGFNAGSQPKDEFISYGNVFLGALAGNKVSGHYNVMIGESAGENYQEGDEINAEYNVFIGKEAGQHATGNNNIYIGSNAGAGEFDNLNTGSRNIFIGNSAGRFEKGNDKLYISNTATSTPLIYGEFVSQKLSLNASVQANDISIKDFLVLEPKSAPPSNPAKGTVYFDDNENTLQIWDGSGWRKIALE